MKRKPFKPRPDQIDFTNARWAPVINCIVFYKNKILLLKRNRELNFYPGVWNSLSGFLDDKKSLEEKVWEELLEEVGITADHITRIQCGEIFDAEAPEYEKTWVVHPMLVEVDTSNIKLNWEAEEYAWVEAENIHTFDIIPGFERVLEKVLQLRDNM